MTHRDRMLPRLKMYVDSELPYLSRLLMMRHLKTCEACRAEAEAMRQIGENIREIGLPELDGALRSRILDAMRAAPGPAQPEPRPAMRTRNLAFAGSLAVIAIAVTLIVRGSTPGRTVRGSVMYDYESAPPQAAAPGTESGTGIDPLPSDRSGSAPVNSPAAPKRYARARSPRLADKADAGPSGSMAFEARSPAFAGSSDADAPLHHFKSSDDAKHGVGAAESAPHTVHSVSIGPKGYTIHCDGADVSVPFQGSGLAGLKFISKETSPATFTRVGNSVELHVPASFRIASAGSPGLQWYPFAGGAPLQALQGLAPALDRTGLVALIKAGATVYGARQTNGTFAGKPIWTAGFHIDIPGVGRVVSYADAISRISVPFAARAAHAGSAGAARGH